MLVTPLRSALELVVLLRNVQIILGDPPIGKKSSLRWQWGGSKKIFLLFFWVPERFFYIFLFTELPQLRTRLFRGAT